MKIVNIANAGLLAFAGIWVFLSQELDPLLVLAACYVLMFSMVLLFWEIKLEACNTCFLKNMGFMFSWKGRLLFFIFVGTLAFGLHLPGVIIGTFTLVNAAFNISVVCTHPTYFEHLREKAEKELQEVLQAEAARYGNKEGGGHDVVDTGGGGTNLHELKDVEDGNGGFSNMASPGGAAAPGANLPAGWEMRTDEHSGTPYWVNSNTGEQSWEKPT
eukprot:CAMPEP_0184488160 /NCGR_PEP_ID=MMETSP0113_2-20130426/10559_1 /TAXON_ID=91329 /ORGANISM="Norrisiella sphaerica, Strain BC52" /LENGTH=215 /DNA_ID=CAMNT_0026870643 /DNA_START=176 /DNA_END=823 /DNA_ORIENTATION=+